MKKQKLPKYNANKVKKKPLHLKKIGDSQIKIQEVDEIFSLLIKEENMEKEVKIVIGNNIVSKKVFSNERAATNYINQKPYEIICTLISLMIDAQQKMSNQKK